MPENKDKPSFIQRILGIDPKKQREDLEKAQAGLRAVQALQGKVQAYADARLEQVKADATASIAASQAQTDRLHEQIAHRPKLLGWVNDGEALKKAALDKYEGKPVDLVDIKNKTTINRWYDGYGHIFYFPPDVGADQVQTISTRIIEQQNAFNALGEFARIAAKTNPNSPYQDFFASDARRIKFQELKQLSA